MARMKSVREFADERGVSVSTIRRWVQDGMPHERGPNGVVIDPRKAKAWLDGTADVGRDEEE